MKAKISSPVEIELTRESLDALPAGTKIVVVWDGGNGPHSYVVEVDEFGGRWASSQGVLVARLDTRSIAQISFPGRE